MGLAWALVSVRRTNREADDDDGNDETIQGSVVFFLARLFEIGPRIVLLTLFITEYQERAFIFCVMHCALCMVWTFIIDRTAFRCKPINVFLKVLIGYPMLFCFVDLDYVYTETSREHIPTRYKMGAYYTIYCFENIVLFGLWVSSVSHIDDWYYVYIVIFTFSGFLHFFFQVLYYKVFHPSSSRISWYIKLYPSLCLYNDPDNVESDMTKGEEASKAISKSETFTVMSV
ncbi:hypothetical protein FSP39_015021 [Pinctada imbricata]|uniref:XK-related protein n=1 Tax=Pinctada imbricata TaxID=66713 RepID=A0AA89BNM7_PINIB|nr:hypothetical protein FSP39_015021 [Pinctada imbricata]